jgi:Ca2+-binding EF-hand superfamily protein
MNSFKVLVAGLSVVVIIIGCATMNDQAASRDFPAICTALDRNNDGVIDKEEFLAGSNNPERGAQIFLQCDMNQDGVISKEEALRNQKLIQNENLKREVIRLTGPQ